MQILISASVEAASASARTTHFERQCAGSLNSEHHTRCSVDILAP